MKFNINYKRLIETVAILLYLIYCRDIMNLFVDTTDTPLFFVYFTSILMFITGYIFFAIFYWIIFMIPSLLIVGLHLLLKYIISINYVSKTGKNIEIEGILCYTVDDKTVDYTAKVLTYIDKGSFLFEKFLCYLEKFVLLFHMDDTESEKKPPKGNALS